MRLLIGTINPLGHVSKHHIPNLLLYGDHGNFRKLKSDRQSITCLCNILTKVRLLDQAIDSWEGSDAGCRVCAPIMKNGSRGSFIKSPRRLQKGIEGDAVIEAM